jgi:hypothetical protein
MPCVDGCDASARFPKKAKYLECSSFRGKDSSPSHRGVTCDGCDARVLRGSGAILRLPAIVTSQETLRATSASVYGSLTTSIAVLLSVEIGALVFLLGAQVIAEFERIDHEPIVAVPQPMRTEAPRQ